MLADHRTYARSCEGAFPADLSVKPSECDLGQALQPLCSVTAVAGGWRIIQYIEGMLSRLDLGHRQRMLVNSSLLILVGLPYLTLHRAYQALVMGHQKYM